MRPIGQPSDKEAEAVRMRADGLTFSAIGASLGVSRSQAKVLVEGGHRSAQLAKDGQSHNASQFLGVRACNGLLYHGIDISAPDAHVSASALSRKEMLHWANFGKSSVKQVEDWLRHNGMSLFEPEPPKQVELSPQCTCPNCGHAFTPAKA